jgi:hypothetical protein
MMGFAQQLLGLAFVWLVGVLPAGLVFAFIARFRKGTLAQRRAWACRSAVCWPWAVYALLMSVLSAIYGKVMLALLTTPADRREAGLEHSRQAAETSRLAQERDERALRDAQEASARLDVLLARVAAGEEVSADEVQGGKAALSGTGTITAVPEALPSACTCSDFERYRNCRHFSVAWREIGARNGPKPSAIRLEQATDPVSGCDTPSGYNALCGLPTGSLVRWQRGGWHLVTGSWPKAGTAVWRVLERGVSYRVVLGQFTSAPGNWADPVQALDQAEQARRTGVQLIAGVVPAGRYWHGALVREAGPVWECSHNHLSGATAQECAEHQRDAGLPL